MARRAKGEGTLYQAKDKSWIYQYTDEDGGRRTKRFRRKADARAYIDSLKATASAPQIPGENPQAGGTTVGEWLDHWLELYAKPTVKLSTCSSYELYIRLNPPPEMVLSDRGGGAR